LEVTGEFTNQVPDINLSEATGIWELSGLVPTCDAGVLDVHTLWSSVSKIKKREKEDSYEQIFLHIFSAGTRPE